MQFNNIQAARAIAANSVVLAHLAVIETKYGHGYRVLSDNAAWGACGVDLFFVVSGFIMATIAARSPAREFVFSRLTRIFPSYWFYTALVLAASLVAPGIVNSSLSQAPSLWKSLFLVPDSTPPLLAVAWTLTHEVYFYAIFAALLIFGGVRAGTLIAWACFCVVGHEALLPTIPILKLIFHPLTLEFIAGAGAGLAVRSGFTKAPALALLCGAFGLLITFSILDPTGVFDAGDSWRRVLALGLPFALIVYGLTATKKTGEVSMPEAVLVRLGDASYSIYLSHVLVLSALGRGFAVMPIHGDIAEAFFVIFCLFAVNIWGLLSYNFIERPAIRYFREAAKSAG